ncbi:hypothetical protein Bca52824_036779 [Brassica carinata]|uniref:DUF4283 domain-containing protein n=1 Tax=Brassica carinata TaxID=52824 RepID=A0A8X7S5J2_BRACI|nr:hypothetical protein Bca52824_036779 [Brassica carinata]
MSPLSSLICRGGSSSSARRNPDPEKEDDIIQIPACDLSMVAERFKRTLIGRVLHQGRSVEAMINLLPRARIWNVEGRVRGVNLGNGRFQFDFDREEDLVMVLRKRPCHFNHWIFALERWEPSTNENFPNTIPFWIKVTGVPVHFCNDGTFEEIAKALGRREAIDATNARIQVAINADNPLQMERKVGFPNGDIGKIKEIREQSLAGTSLQQRQVGPLGSTRNFQGTNKRPRSPASDTMGRASPRSYHPGDSRVDKRVKTKENYWNSRPYGEERYTSKDLYRRGDEKLRQPVKASQKENVWKRLENQTMRRSEDYHDRRYQERSTRYQGDEAYKSKNRNSQITVSIGPQRRMGAEGQRNGVNRGTVIIREAVNHPPKETARYDSTPNLARNGIERSSLELEHLMQSEHIENMVMTRDDEVEVDKLVDEFGDVDMTENMIQNDDLLVDEPGYDAEIIDAISQLSPANAETFDKNENIQKRGSKASTKSKTNMLKNQGRSSCAEAKRGTQNSPDLKGAKASKKLSALLIRQSPSKTKGLGASSKPKSLKVPRIEVFPSAKSRSSVAVSGSVGSQKPPSKKI